MPRPILKFSLTLVMLMACLAPALRAQTGVVTANGVPVPGATVTATQGSTTLTTFTDGNGRYKFDGLTNGKWTLHVSMFLFAPENKEVAVNGPASVDFKLTLQSRAAAAAPKKPEQRAANTAASSRPAQGQRAGGNGGTPGAGRSGGYARNGSGSRQNQSFQATELTNQLDPSLAGGDATTEMPTGVQNDSANDAFLLSGTLSRGLQQVGGDPGGGPDGMGGPGFGRGFGDNPNGPGFDGNGGPGGPGGGFGGPGGPGGGGPGGFGGGGGGFGGRGGGGGFGGGRGGFGGPGGGRFPGARGRGPTDYGAFGNRRNRGQQGIHGLVNVVLHNSIFDARPFAINGQEVPKPSYAQERISMQIGGPLMIPKLFKLKNTTFALNFTTNLASSLSSQVGTVPTLAERSGDFSDFNQTIYNPLTHTPYPGNVIPSSAISPIALGLLKYFPAPNQTGSCSADITGACNAQNFRYTTTVPSHNYNFGLRLGQSLGTKDRLSLNLQTQDRTATSAQDFGFLDTTSGAGESVGLNWIHTFARRVFNTAGVTFNRNRTTLVPFFSDTSDVSAELGILGTSSNPLDYGPPNLSFTNYAALTDGSASRTIVQSVTGTDSFNWFRGKHLLNFGGQFQRADNNLETNSNGRGTYTFTGLQTSAFGANGLVVPNTGNDFADFLLGLPNSSSIRYGDTNTYFRANNYAFFAQDDWRWLSNFTLNFGLRYEYFGVPHEKYGHEANLDISPGFTAVAPVQPGQMGPYSGVFPSGLVNPDHNNFSPRIGIAWRPWKQGKTVVRSGYGVYYNGGVYNSFMRNLSAQPPFADTNSVVTSSAAPLTLVDGFIILPPGKIITNSWAIDKNYRVPYAQTWNFQIQQDLPWRLVAQVGYLGTKGTRLDTQQIPNVALPGSQLTSEERLMIANATSFVYESSNANSNYNSLRATLIRRFSRGISFNADYVFAKAIDDASTFGGGVAQNPFDIAAERSLSNFDRRHTFNARFVFTSPFGHNSRLLTHHDKFNKFLEDWTLSGGATAETGIPLNPRVLGNQSDAAGTGVIGTERPNATGIPANSGSGYFNPLAFALPTPGTFGTAGRNTIEGPGLFSLNASFGRPFTFGERKVLEFRFDGTNVLNTVNITGVGTTVNSTTFGLPLAASAMRSLSVTLRFRF